MTPSVDALRILLLRARSPADPAKEDERRSSARRAGLEPERFESHDLLEGPPTASDLRRYDAVMVGGSGDFYVSRENLPHRAGGHPAKGWIVDLHRVAEDGHGLVAPDCHEGVQGLPPESADGWVRSGLQWSVGSV